MRKHPPLFPIPIPSPCLPMLATKCYEMRPSTIENLASPKGCESSSNTTSSAAEPRRHPLRRARDLRSRDLRSRLVTRHQGPTLHQQLLGPSKWKALGSCCTPVGVVQSDLTPNFRATVVSKHAGSLYSLPWQSQSIFKRMVFRCLVGCLTGNSL